MKHDDEPATSPSVKEIVEPPLGADSIAKSPQVDVAFAGEAMVTSVGKVSVNESCSTGVGFPLLIMSKRSVDTPPGPMVSGINVFVKSGPVATPALDRPGDSNEIITRIKEHR